MKKFICLLAITIALSLSGCASTNTLSKEDRASIRSIELVVTEYPNNLLLYAAGDDLKAIALVALQVRDGALYKSPNESEVGLLSAFLKDNNIVIKDIVSTEVSKKISELGFKQVASGADAVLKVEIMGYGFDQARPFSNELKGTVRLMATIVRPDGKPLVTQRFNICGPFTDFKSHTAKEIFADPFIARDQFTRCSAIAFAEIAKGYGKTEK